MKRCQRERSVDQDLAPRAAACHPNVRRYWVSTNHVNNHARLYCASLRAVERVGEVGRDGKLVTCHFNADREDLDHVAACKRLHRCGKAKGKKTRVPGVLFRGRRQGRQPLNPARGPLAVALPYGSSLLSVGERGRRPSRRPLPPAKNYRVLRCFVLFAFFRLFRSLWLQMGQHAPTWTSRCANIAPKMGQPGPKMGPT